jgi:hypothetical protein
VRQVLAPEDITAVAYLTSTPFSLTDEFEINHLMEKSELSGGWIPTHSRFPKKTSLHQHLLSD